MTTAAAVGTLFFVAVVTGVLVSWPVYRGLRRRSRYRLVAETPTATPGDAAPGDTVLLTGTLRAGDDGVTGPVSGAVAPLAAWALDEFQDESTQLKYWTPTARGLRVTRGSVADDGESVALPSRTVECSTGEYTGLTGYDAVTGFDVDETLVEVADWDRVEEVSPTDSLPPRLQDLEEAVGLDAAKTGVTLIDLGRTHGTRRYREARVEAGETVTVRGTVREEDDGPVLGPPADGPGLVTDLDPDALARRYRWAYRKRVYGALALWAGVVGFAAVVITV